MQKTRKIEKIDFFEKTTRITILNEFFLKNFSENSKNSKNEKTAKIEFAILCIRILKKGGAREK